MKVIKSDGSSPEAAAPALRPRGVVDKAEYAALTGAKAIMDLVARSVDIAFKDDPTVEAGGCVIQTEFGTIDAQLDTQFKMLAQVLIADTAKKEGPA